jgi:hypothetical protein
MTMQKTESGSARVVLIHHWYNSRQRLPCAHERTGNHGGARCGLVQPSKPGAVMRLNQIALRLKTHQSDKRPCRRNLSTAGRHACAGLLQTKPSARGASMPVIFDPEHQPRTQWIEQAWFTALPHVLQICDRGAFDHAR